MSGLFNLHQLTHQLTLSSDAAAPIGLTSRSPA
jgi:hypothetical protein